MNPRALNLISGLPGAKRIEEGLRDYHESRRTPAACLVRMARRRLVKAGLMESTREHEFFPCA